MNTILTFSGWGQQPDALMHVCPAPENTKMTYMDYSQYGDITQVFDKLTGRNCDLAIGWSLGGQIALRAIHQGVITPSHVLLLAAPFQFCRSADYPEGMPPEMLTSIKASYQQDPTSMLLQFASLIAQGDRQNQLLPMLHQQMHPTNPHWLYWLDELAAFSCKTLNPTTIPPIYIVHGTKDHVIPYAQSQYFLNYFRKVHIDTRTGCGHAPHLDNPDHFYYTICHALSS